MRTCFISKRRHACTLAAELCVTHTHIQHVSHKQKYHISHKTMTHITHTHAPSQTDNNTSPSFFFSIAIYFGWIYAEHFTPDEIERTQLQNLQINFKERERKKQWYNNCSGRHQISCTSRHMGSSSNSETLETGSRIDPSGSRVVVFGIVHHHCHLLSSGAGGQKQTGPPTSGLLLISMLTDIVPE